MTFFLWKLLSEQQFSKGKMSTTGLVTNRKKGEVMKAKERRKPVSSLEQIFCCVVFCWMCLSSVVLFSTPAVGVANSVFVPDRLAGQMSCHPKTVTPETEHSECQFPKQSPEDRDVTFDFLVMRGPFEKTAYQHGLLLGDKVADGLVAHVKNTKSRFLDKLPEKDKKLYTSLLNCFNRRLIDSSDREFLAVHRNLAKGLADAGHKEITENDVLEMSYSTELSQIVSGLQRKLKRSPVEAYAEIVATCGGDILAGGILNVLETTDLTPSFSTLGCTGIAATPSATEDRSLWMARNLDGSAIGAFNKHPVVILHDPNWGAAPKAPKKFRYVGVGSAGLHYTGGNAGFNEVGIGVTIHEMETEKYRTSFLNPIGLSAVYLQNRILERAASIDDVWEMVQDTGNFTSWTIVVGDAKTGEVATFEFSGQKQVIAKRINSGFHGQSNHFQDHRMRDHFYNYSYNKVLESRFRLKRLEEMAQGFGGIFSKQFLVNTLSDHWDATQGLRSFGRNLIKTNTMMTNLFSPQSGIFLTSLGDKYPVGQGRFLEFKVNFKNTDSGENVFEMAPFVTSQNKDFSDKKDWKKALTHYVEAYLIYKQNTDDLGAMAEAREKLESAMFQSEIDGKPEFPYHFISAKLDLKQAAILFLEGDKEKAFQLLEKGKSNLQALLKLTLEPRTDALPSVNWVPYDLALVRVWLARVLELEQGAQRTRSDEDGIILQLADEARKLLEPLFKSERQSFELQKFLESFSPSFGKWKSYSMEEAAKLNIDFVTVE
jgi:tetratricopeptide (TPR) repeat protein